MTQQCSNRKTIFKGYFSGLNISRIPCSLVHGTENICTYSSHKVIWGLLFKG